MQDVEIPVDRTAEFVRWFAPRSACDRSGCARCDCASPSARAARTRGRSTRSARGTTYVNVGFWGTVQIAPGRADGDVNRAIEQEVTDLGGHKSLYSDAYYDEATFAALYGADELRTVRQRVTTRTTTDGTLREGGETADDAR